MGKVRVYSRLLREGQVIKGSVVDEKGLVVVGDGTVVTPRTIALLMDVGIETVYVDDTDYFKWQEYLFYEERRKRVERMFAPYKKDGRMNIVKKAILDALYEKKREGGD